MEEQQLTPEEQQKLEQRWQEILERRKLQKEANQETQGDITAESSN